MLPNKRIRLFIDGLVYPQVFPVTGETARDVLKFVSERFGHVDELHLYDEDPKATVYLDPNAPVSVLRDGAKVKGLRESTRLLGRTLRPRGADRNRSRTPLVWRFARPPPPLPELLEQGVPNFGLLPPAMRQLIQQGDLVLKRRWSPLNHRLTTRPHP